MDSAIGLSTMIAIGADGFGEMLAGFRAMDEHFRTTSASSRPSRRPLPAQVLAQQTLRGADPRDQARSGHSWTASRLT